MTQEHETGANHVVEVIHRFLNRRRTEGPIPKKLFVQLDNCTRENKNRYVMGFFEMLVSKSVFDSVEVGFLPIGHTHEDVDQCFSTTSARLRLHNAVTLNELHEQLRFAYGGNVQVEHMRRIINWSGLCDMVGCLRKIDKISIWRYFLFSIDKSNSGLNGARLTTCHVKQNCGDAWLPLFPYTKNGKAGILRHLPNLSQTPNLNIKCPDGRDKINKRLESEEGRINSSDKMIELHALRDFVFQDRVDSFHWDLPNCVESGPQQDVQQNDFGEERNDISKECTDQGSGGRKRGQGASHSDVPAPAPSLTPGSSSAEPYSKFNYSLDTFVLVQPDVETNSKSIPFWVGRVVELFNDRNSHYVRRLRVHWYDDNSNRTRGTDYSTYKFHPCYIENPDKARGRKVRPSKVARQDLRVPNRDIIDTDTVIVAFESLTRRHNVPLSALKQLPVL